MKKRLLYGILALCVLASGCTAGTAALPSPAGVRVYRVLAPEYREGGALLSAETRPLDPGRDAVLQAAAAVAGTPEDVRLQSPVPGSVWITGAAREENVAVVSLNAGYLDVAGIEKTLLDACLTLTLCSVEGVDFVSLRVGSETIEDRLSSEDFLLFDAVVSSGRAQVRVYFPKTAGQTLGSEYRSISFEEDNSAERAILDALFDGPASPELKRVLPPGALVLSVYTLDGLCSVSLSGLDPGDGALSAEEARLAAYAIVNSLTELSRVRSVQLLVDGQPIQSLWGFDVSAPLTRDEALIGSVAA